MKNRDLLRGAIDVTCFHVDAGEEVQTVAQNINNRLEGIELSVLLCFSFFLGGGGEGARG